MSEILISDDDGCIGTVTLEVPGAFTFSDTYQWTITSQPLGSNPTLSSTTGQSVQLTTDVAGCYEVNVTVTSIQ